MDGLSMELGGPGCQGRGWPESPEALHCLGGRGLTATCQEGMVV